MLHMIIICKIKVSVILINKKTLSNIEKSLKIVITASQGIFNKKKSDMPLTFCIIGNNDFQLQHSFVHYNNIYTNKYILSC